jgi:hypothetical protein
VDLSAQVSGAPAELVDWFSAKDVGFFELENLLPLPDEIATGPFLQLFLQASPSKGEGCKVLEILKELALFGDLATLSEPRTWDELKRQVYATRYPMRSQQIESLTTKSKRLSWPKHAQTRWNFDADQPSLEVRLNLKSAEDFKKLVHSWATISEQLRAEDMNPWG